MNKSNKTLSAVLQKQITNETSICSFMAQASKQPAAGLLSRTPKGQQQCGRPEELETADMREIERAASRVPGGHRGWRLGLPRGWRRFPSTGLGCSTMGSLGLGARPVGVRPCGSGVRLHRGVGGADGGGARKPHRETKRMMR
jgi:hypothetical protein